jgi:TRAP-type C4-dicarboxylate transport system substrate-binding protein
MSRRSGGATVDVMRSSGLILVGVLLVACASQSPATRGGAADQARQLTAGAYFAEGFPSGDSLAHLARALSSSTSGNLTLHVVTPPDSSLAKDASSAVLARVQSGQLDVGLIATRSVDLAGVTSFQALQAPLHFTSLEQADAVLADPIADRMMAPMTSLGVTPLALTFDALRMVKGYQQPLIAPANYVGKSVAFRPSAITREVISALGATEDPTVGPEFEERVKAGLANGLEDSINQPNAQADGVVAGNEFLSLKANVILVNSAVWNGLSANQQASLRSAAVDTRAFASAAMVTHIDLAQASKALCQAGNDVVIAPPEALVAMKQTLAPVERKLRTDPLTSAAIDRIDAIGASVPDATTAIACTHPSPPSTGPWAPVAPKGDQTVLDGTYRMLVRADDLVAAGWESSDAHNQAGIWTLSVTDDGLTLAKENDRPCSGKVLINGHHASVLGSEDCLGRFTIRVTHTGDRMVFDQVHGADPTWDSRLDAFYAPGFVRTSS